MLIGIVVTAIFVLALTETPTTPADDFDAD